MLQEVCLDTRSSPFLQKAKRKKKKKKEKEKSKRPEARRQSSDGWIQWRRRRTGNTCFIGCISFLAMPLCAFSKKIRKLKKGYFCHKFNIPQNQLYVGPYPAKDYYMPEVMSVKGRNKSEEGHVAQQGKILIFKNFTLTRLVRVRRSIANKDVWLSKNCLKRIPISILLPRLPSLLPTI